MKFKIANKAEKKAEIFIYEDIGEGWFGGISANTFVKEVKALGELDQIDLRINSPGGNVFDGVAIYNFLKSHNATVTSYVDGLAASIASIVAMAGDTIHMANNSLMMIHNPLGRIEGFEEDMRDMADVLATVKDNLIDTYAERTSIGKTDIAALMQAETWMTAEEAVEFGFADGTVEDMQIAAAVDVDRYKYRRVPKEYKNRYSDRAVRDARFTRVAAAVNRLVPKTMKDQRK